MPYVFFYPATHSLDLFRIGMFFAGFCTVAQLSFWGNYLPRVYPVHLRGTGEGFSANVGGRMLGTSASFVTTHLARTGGATPAIKLALRGGSRGVLHLCLRRRVELSSAEPPKTLVD